MPWMCCEATWRNRRGPMPTSKGRKEIVVCSSGASCARLSGRFLARLLSSKEVQRVHFTASEAFQLVFEQEESKKLRAFLDALPNRSKLAVYGETELRAPVASGSYPVAGTVVIPASASTVGAVASGSGQKLGHRCAEVALKEGRPLLVVVRETPMSLVLLRNLVTLREAGALIIPFIPSCYHRPETLDDVADHFIMRLFDHLGLTSDFGNRWK